ncbi:MAG: hypothetical protein LBF00_00735 [Mycoplasmataceae bacterium]|nr:hypothetical protein [Mycoplasmataceae bacterium]
MYRYFQSKIYALVKGLLYYKNGILCYPNGVKVISKNYIPKMSYFDKFQTFIEHRANKKKNSTVNLANI